MLKIEEGVIYITRGDDAVIDVQVTKIDGETYEMQPGDTITLTVREKPEEISLPICTITGETGVPRLAIRSADTSGADPGQYSADIQLNTQDGKKYTIWPELDGSQRYKTANLKNFVIMPEVTMN